MNLLKNIQINNFRSFDTVIFEFNPQLTIIAGKNSVGKTNLLESIFFLLKAKGFREKTEEELIQNTSTHAEVRGIIEGKSPIELRIYLENKEKINKSCFIDRVKKRTFDYSKEMIPLVIFSPSFMYVIDGETSERRSFIDSIITTTDILYKRKLHNYETALRKRNKILEKGGNLHALKEELTFWDNYLIEEASYIVSKRKEFTQFLNNNPLVDKKEFKLEYKENTISHKTLTDTFEKQILIRKTLVGPQRDLFEISIKDKNGFLNVHKFGSRSQQRLALFWIMLNEIQMYKNYTKMNPIVLLDDIFSELDEDNKHLILKLIEQYQTIITTTEENISSLIDFPSTTIRL